MTLRTLVFFFLALTWMPFPSHAAERIGVLCLHGKLRSPEQMAGIAGYLRREGLLISVPELSWSASRSYNKTLEASAIEVTAAIDALRKQGLPRSCW
jgi:hypothetical protein